MDANEGQDLTPLQRAVGEYSVNFGKAQFYGYEGSNAVALALTIATTVMNQLHNGSPIHPFAAMDNIAYPMLFCTGSTLIYTMDIKTPPFEKNLYSLFYGSLSLAAGGFFLAAAGFPISGLSILWASLETTRSAAKAILETKLDPTPNLIEHPLKWAGHMAGHALPREAPKFFDAMYGYTMSCILDWEIPPWDRLPAMKSLHIKPSAISKALHKRPMFWPQMVKALGRSDVIIQSAVHRNWPMVGIGLAWLAADFSLAMLDGRFRHWVRHKAGLPVRRKKLLAALARPRQGYATLRDKFSDLLFMDIKLPGRTKLVPAAELAQ